MEVLLYSPFKQRFTQAKSSFFWSSASKYNIMCWSWQCSCSRCRRCRLWRDCFVSDRTAPLDEVEVVWLGTTSTTVFFINCCLLLFFLFSDSLARTRLPLFIFLFATRLWFLSSTSSCTYVKAPYRQMYYKAIRIRICTGYSERWDASVLLLFFFPPTNSCCKTGSCSSTDKPLPVWPVLRDLPIFHRFWSWTSLFPLNGTLTNWLQKYDRKLKASYLENHYLWSVLAPETNLLRQ